MSTTDQWDWVQATNPDTCLHFIAKDLAGLRVCFSCNSTLSNFYIGEFVWDWDGIYEYWVRRSIRESRRALSERHPLLGVRDSRQFKIYRNEFPAIFRFEGKLFIEDFDIDQNINRFLEVTPERAEYWLANNVAASDSAIEELRRKLGGG